METTAAVPKPKAAARPRAKGKTAKAKPKVFRLADMPVSVFYEMATHLRPMDLLNLARTNKTFRRVLMSKHNARQIWRTSLRNMPNVRVPPMPEDMCEPAWINLLLSYQCHYCLKKGPHPVYWDVRLRLCASCKREDAWKFEMVPKHTFFDHFSYEFEEDIGETVIFEAMPVLSSREVEEFMLKYGMYEYRDVDYRALKRELRNATVEERTTIIRERQAVTKARREHINRYLLDWEITQRHIRSYEKYEVAIGRRKAIIAKLRELGWGSVIDQMSKRERDEFSKLREVDQFKALTDRIWSMIKNTCIEYMEELRADHEEFGPSTSAVKGWDGREIVDLDFWRGQVRSSFDPLSDCEEFDEYASDLDS